MNPLFHTEFSISDSLKNVRKSVLIYETIIGWYSLCDDEGIDICMLVFESQLDGFLKMKQDKESWIHDENLTAEQVVQKYFTGFGDKPLLSDMKILLNNFRNNEIAPTLHALAHRKTIDPLYVANRAEKENRDVIDLAGEIYDEYEVARDLYPTKEIYQEKVSKAKIYKNKKIIVGQKIEELPTEWIDFDRAPYHDLQKLADEVVQEMFGGLYPDINEIAWTDKPYKGFYGRFWSESHNIEINCVLNSKDVNPEVIKFLIYHEILHRKNRLHDKVFYKEEHKYPKWEEYENFLNEKMYKFDIKEW